MKYCPECRITCTAQASSCPLCHKVLQGADAIPEHPGEAPFFPPLREAKPSARERFMRRRPLIGFIGTISFLVPSLVCIFVDIVLSGTASWSLVVVLSLVLTWSYFFLVLLLYGEAVPMTTAAMVMTSAYLYVLGAFYGDLSWVFALGIPITLACGLGVLALHTGARLLKGRMAAVFSLTLTLVALFCVVIDACVGAWQTGVFRLGWSLVVLVSLGPLAVLSLTFEVIYRKSSWVRRTFNW